MIIKIRIPFFSLPTYTHKKPIRHNIDKWKRRQEGKNRRSNPSNLMFVFLRAPSILYSLALGITVSKRIPSCIYRHFGVSETDLEYIRATDNEPKRGSRFAEGRGQRCTRERRKSSHIVEERFICFLYSRSETISRGRGIQSDSYEKSETGVNVKQDLVRMSKSKKDLVER